MSKQVDERVVSMEFNNKNFEKNVSTTMSTLDKLKQKLNLDGASKGLENVNSAAKNVNLDGISSGVAALEKRFSTMGIVGMTVIQNLTNSAMQLGSKLTSWFTGGIVQGGITRAMNLEKARFQLQGLLKDSDKVEAVMKNVNASVDGTAYSLDQAAVVASQFAATGMEAGEKMEGALRAVAGTAAMTSADYQRVGLIFTQISGQGRVMGNDLLQLSNLGINAAATLATYLGKTESEVRNMVSKGEISFEMFAEAMDSAFGEHAAKANSTFTGAMSNVKAALARIGAEFVSPLLVENGPLVKFFNTLREKVNDIKKVIGPIASTFTKFASTVINGATNIISKIDFSKPLKIFGALELSFSKVGNAIKTVAAPVEKVSESLKDLGNIVNDVIIGKFGNGEERFNTLTKAGYNYYNVQNKVNETLGNSFRYTQDQINAQEKLIGTQTEATESQKELTNVDSEHIAKLAELSDAELKSLGYTNEQIQALRDVKKEADKLGMPIQEFIDNIDELDGKTLIIESFKNIAKGLGAALTSVGDAWKNVFPPKSMEEKQQGLYNIIAAFHKFSEGVKRISDEANEEGSTVNKLRRTFEGLFTVIKMVSTLVSGPIKIAFKIFRQILGMFNLDILDVTAAIGDAIVGFDKWISSTFDFTKVFGNIAPGVKDAVNAIREWIDSLKDSENLPKDIADGIMSGLSTVWHGITGFVSQIGESISNGLNGVPGNMISGFANGIWNGIQVAGQVMVELGSQILLKFREVLGIHSPSTETQSDGKNFILGFIEGVKRFASQAWECIKGFASKCAEVVGNINWSGIFAGGLAIGLVSIVKKLNDNLEVLAAPFKGVGSVLSGVGKILDEASKHTKKVLKNVAKVVKSFSKVLNGLAFDMKAEGIKRLATSIAILVGCIIALTFFDSDQLWESVKIIAALAGVLTLLAIVTEKMSKSSVSIDKNGAKVSDVNKSLVGIAASLLLLAVVAKIIGGMSWDEMIKAGIGITFLGGIITGLIAATKLAGNNLDKVGQTILMISGAIALLAVVAVILGLVPLENLERGIAAVSILGIIMALLIAATKNAQKCVGNIVAMTVAIAVMAAAVVVLSYIDPDKLVGPVIAMGILMGMFSLMSVAAGKAKGSTGALVAMTVVVVALAGIIYLLSGLPIESTISSAIALSALMLAMTGVLFILSKMGNSAAKALVGIVALTAMAVPLLAFVGVLALASLVQNATQNAILLAGLATVLTILLLPLTLVGTFAVSALLGVLALTAMAVPLLAFVGVLAIMQCIGDASKNVLLLMTLMTVLTDCLVKVALVAPLAVIGVAAIAALTVLMVAVGALAVAVGALMETFPQLEEFLDAGIPILEKLAYAVGSMVGNLIAGFSEALMDTLPKLGLCLSQFMLNATPFIVGVKMVDQSVMDGVGTLSLAVLALTAADLLAGVASFLQGGSTFADLGTELSQFILNATPFIVGAKMLDPKAMQGVKLLAETILLLTASDILDGLTSWFTGGSSFADFGEQLAPFGEGIADFADSVSGLDESSLTAMNSAAQAGKTLAEMASSLPNSGGLMGKIFGENDMDTFGTQLEAFGTSLVNYGDSVVDLNADAVDDSVPAAKSLSDLAENLPNSGGLMGKIFGDNDMKTFGAQLEAFGTSLTNYGDSVAELNIDAIDNSVPAAKSLSDLAENLPDSGGVWTVFGDNDMKTFGAQLEAFGTSLVTYGDTVSKLNVTCINGSVGAAKSLSELASNLPEAAGWFETNDFTEFGKNLVSFGGSMVEYSNKISGIDTSTLSSATFEFQKIANMASGISDVDFSGVTSLGESLNSIGSNAVNDFIKAFTDAYSKVSEAGSSMITKLVDGVDDRKSTAKSVFTALVENCVTAIKKYYNNFYNAGSYLGDGLVVGINDKQTDVYNAGYELGQKAVQGEKDGQHSKSPSKLTIRAGKWLGEGLIIGIKYFGRKVYKSGYELGDKAVSSISSAISKISDIIDSDMDSQPTIRPVVDLDDVYSGVNAMNSMFNLQPSVGVLSNVGSIDYAMNRRNQNGGNSEVISAINRLHKDLENVKGNTYNVNGITYDDGSNVSEAVSSLIRAARVERRV